MARSIESCCAIWARRAGFVLSTLVLMIKEEEEALKALEWRKKVLVVVGTSMVLACFRRVFENSVDVSGRLLFDNGWMWRGL